MAQMIISGVILVPFLVLLFAADAIFLYRLIAGGFRKMTAKLRL